MPHLIPAQQYLAGGCGKQSATVGRKKYVEFIVKPAKDFEHNTDWFLWTQGLLILLNPGEI